MPETLTVNLGKAIASAQMLDDFVASAPQGQLSDTDRKVSADNSDAVQNEAIAELYQTLQGLVVKLDDFCEKIFAQHREEITKLAVEIARKILAEKVEDGDYKMEPIIEEALKNAPTRQDIIVHLNPKDLAQFQKLQEESSTGSWAGIEFIGDPNLGQAECTLETPKGIIKSLINQHLEQIAEALKK